MTRVVKKLQRELRSFSALSIINIVFSGVAMALGISLVVQNILDVVAKQFLQLSQVGQILMGFFVSGIALRWLLSGADILDGVTDIKAEYEKMKDSFDDENITRLIVKMMAYYRDNKSTIHKLTLLSKIVGICFFINGVLLLMDLPSILIVPSLHQVLPVIAIILNFGVSISGILIPHFFNNYSSSWEYRLKESINIERELGKQFEDD